LDNISQEDNQKNGQEDFNPKSSGAAEDSDIQFEEIIDIDKIQRKLKQQFGGFSDEELAAEAENVKFDANTEIVGTADFSPMQETTKPESNRLEIDPKDKKYVVYIDYDNIEFMENLSPSERKETINKILKEQHKVITNNKIVEDRNNFIKHVIIATITFVIGFPLMFISVNKAMELTMENYDQAKTNIMKLYKKQGKIQSSDSSSADNFKY